MANVTGTGRALEALVSWQSDDPDTLALERSRKRRQVTITNDTGAFSTAFGTGFDSLFAGRRSSLFEPSVA